MRGSFLAAFFVAAISSGCGGSKPVLPPPPPHGGTAFSLPDGKGFVEVLQQEVPDQPAQTQLVVYFMDSECKPMSSAPSAVSFQPKGKKAGKIALTPTIDFDSSKAGGFASTPFAHPGEVAGMLSATIESKPVLVAISTR